MSSVRMICNLDLSGRTAASQSQFSNVNLPQRGFQAEFLDAGKLQLVVTGQAAVAGTSTS